MHATNYWADDVTSVAAEAGKAGKIPVNAALKMIVTQNDAKDEEEMVGVKTYATIEKPERDSKLGIQLVSDKDTGKTWVHSLVPDGICEASGLKKGDILLFVGGYPVTGAKQATQVMLEHDAGSIILEFQRALGSSSSTIFSENV